MTKIERIYNIFEIIFAYLLNYGFAIGFIFMGIILFFSPTNPGFPQWAGILIGLIFILGGCIFMHMGIRLSLWIYREIKLESDFKKEMDEDEY